MNAFHSQASDSSTSPEIKRPRIYNCHTHIFSIDHVPDRFARRMSKGTKGRILGLIRISWIKKYKLVRRIVASLGFIERLMKPSSFSAFRRMINLAQFADIEPLSEEEKTMSDQEVIFQRLQSYYPKGTSFVVLSMDMEHMGAGKPAVSYEEQLAELAALKQKYSKELLPFLFVDPRRTQAELQAYRQKYLDNDLFSGLKIYPALGYFPFDYRLMDMYSYAQERELPIITHCIRGVVHYRGNKDKQWQKHPLRDDILLGEPHPIDFCHHFTHPLNYLCLLKEELLNEYLAKERNYKGGNLNLQNLKICFGHFGGEDEWMKYLHDPWIPAHTGASMDLSWWNLKRPYSWFSIILDLIRSEQYPNVYADISYTLADERCFALLKTILEEDSRVRERVLFGTDFYVVSQQSTERAFSIKLRGYLGQELYRQITETNPEKFLSTKPIPPAQPLTMDLGKGILI